MGRVLNAKEQEKLFVMMGDVKNLDVDRICKVFSRSRLTKKVRYSVDDIIMIGPEESPFVEPGSQTTIGLYIANKYLWEDLGIFGYINKTVDGGVNKKIDKQLSKALMEGDITAEQWGAYIDRCQWLFGGPLAFIINTSISETILTLPAAAKKRRAELLEQNKEKLAANDPQTAAHIEKEVVKVALDEIRATGDPAIALFDSGCGVDPYNNYKTICVMKGAIEDNTGESPTGYKVITSNYDTGVSKEDMPKIADTVVTSSYSSGVATQDSGANGKKYNAMFQNVRVQEKGSYCGDTHGYLTKITENHVYRWILEGSKQVMLTPDNIDKYLGKTVRMLSPITCKAKWPEYCSKCIGDRPYRVGIKNIGLSFMTISGSTLNASLKKKHDVSIKFHQVSMEDIMKYVQ